MAKIETKTSAPKAVKKAIKWLLEAMPQLSYNDELEIANTLMADAVKKRERKVVRR